MENEIRELIEQAALKISSTLGTAREIFYSEARNEHLLRTLSHDDIFTLTSNIEKAKKASELLCITPEDATILRMSLTLLKREMHRRILTNSLKIQ